MYDLRNCPHIHRQRVLYTIEKNICASADHCKWSSITPPPFLRGETARCSMFGGSTAKVSELLLDIFVLVLRLQPGKVLGGLAPLHYQWDYFVGPHFQYPPVRCHIEGLHSQGSYGPVVFKYSMCSKLTCVSRFC